MNRTTMALNSNMQNYQNYQRSHSADDDKAILGYINEQPNNIIIERNTAIPFSIKLTDERYKTLEGLNVKPI